MSNRTVNQYRNARGQFGAAINPPQQTTELGVEPAINDQDQAPRNRALPPEDFDQLSDAELNAGYNWWDSPEPRSASQVIDFWTKAEVPLVASLNVVGEYRLARINPLPNSRIGMEVHSRRHAKHREMREKRFLKLAYPSDQDWLDRWEEQERHRISATYPERIHPDDSEAICRVMKMHQDAQHLPDEEKEKVLDHEVALGSNRTERVASVREVWEAYGLIDIDLVIDWTHTRSGESE